MGGNRRFYVDADWGNDKNSGQEEGKAWKTLERLQKIHFAPGDKIYLKRGCQWKGMFSPKGSGSEETPIILETYGTGKRPVIDGAGAYAAVYLNGVSHWMIRGIHAKNRADIRRVRQGICVMGKPIGITKHIWIEDCEISEVDGENRRELRFYESMYWNGGIYVSMPGRSSKENHLHDVVIYNNFIHDVRTSGIRVNQQEDFINDIHHTHVVIKGNRVERTGSDGIIVANCVSPLIDSNRCLDAGMLGNKEETKVIAGIWVCATSHALIQYNEVARTRLFDNDGTAFDTDWGTEGSTIFQYNYSHDNEGGFWLDCIGLNRNLKSERTILRYNISCNDGRCIIQGDTGIGADLYGNLLIHTEGNLSACDGKEGISHHFFGNIFDETTDVHMNWKKCSYWNNWYTSDPINKDRFNSLQIRKWAKEKYWEKWKNGKDWEFDETLKIMKQLAEEI